MEVTGTVPVTSSGRYSARMLPVGRSAPRVETRAAPIAIYVQDLPIKA